jgi:hypothetical protein
MMINREVRDCPTAKETQGFFSEQIEIVGLKNNVLRRLPQG